MFENINIRSVVATALARDGIIVDVRTAKKFQQGHIPMSINLPMDKIEKRQVSLPKGKILLVYCDTGGSSIQAARLLSQMGYKVINCIGGLNHYNASLTK